MLPPAGTKSATTTGNHHPTNPQPAPGHRHFGDQLSTDPEAQRFYADWHDVARNSVAGFRFGHGEAPDDPRIQQVLDELLDRSPEFARLWTTHDARGKALESKRFHHHDVGPITLTMQTFDVRSTPGQALVVYHAAPGTPSSQALTLLGTLAATVREES
ncbi:hypothetical protein K7711_08820 [Nocardia sp. CA2R105]|uniref:MmyB family transcriptional regulator n=1 Tax=Nocardia coffeae TaxID=2873381 RepID=UPI001CA74FF4|nr:hypothetical protein [Nocardia coffeae]MBY8856576.1 hypothetical protein [Nocardia coffeae]